MDQQKVVHVPIYWIIVGMAMMVISPFLSIIAAVKIQENHAAQAERKAAAVLAQQREESRRAACLLFTRILDGYLESPPPSATGRNVVDAWLDLYKLSGCQPPRSR